MPQEELKVIGGSNQETSPQFDSEQSINWSPIFDPVKKQTFMRRTGGTLTIDSLNTTDSVGRASFDKDDLMFQVVGENIYKFDTSLTKVEIGTLTTFNGYVGIASDGLTVVFVDGAFGYVYTIATDTFETIVSPGFPDEPIDVAFQQGFYLVIQGDSNRFYQSAEGNPLIWNAENFAQANSNGDNLVAIRSLNNRLWLQATNSMTIWEDQGTAGFAFRQDTDILYNFGVYTTKSTQVDEGYLIFFARTTAGVGSVYMTEGSKPKVVSNPAIDYQFTTLTNPNDAEAFIFKENGQLYYQLNFTTDSRTFLYNVTSNIWLERMMIDRTRHIATSYCFFNNTPYILSYNSNKMLKMDQTLLTDDGVPIYRRRISAPFMMPTNKNFIINFIQLLIQSGIGLNGVPVEVAPNYVMGAKPRIYLSLSRDGGRVFGNAHAESMGLIGEYGTRIRFRKLGRMKARSMCSIMIEVFDPVEVVLMGGLIDYTECYQ